MGMPNSGAPGTADATPQASTPDSGFIMAIPAGPGAKWTPAQIVTGFLNANASISYTNYQSVAQEYLTSAAIRGWSPTWSVEVVDQVNPPAIVSQDATHATVQVTGRVRASFDGTGQYVGAQSSRGNTQDRQQFDLVKVGGQWRITNPVPTVRLLSQSDFAQVYRAQDLYFFDPGLQVLVPDSVFVPAGTSESNVANNLVEALATAPKTPWLKNGDNPPVGTAFPPDTKIDGVTVDGTTATVSLGIPPAKNNDTTLGQISAQLVWTLIGRQQGPQQPIQAVQLVVNGQPWIPPKVPCPGPSGPNQSPAQKFAMYACYDPYPAAASSAFYYTVSGQAWSRCATQSQATAGTLGPLVALFTRNGAARPQPSCSGQNSVQASSPAVPPAPSHGLPALSRVAVSPDNKYVAGVVSGASVVNVWASNAGKPYYSLPASGVTAIGWDRNDYLWVAADQNITLVIPAGSGFTRRGISSGFNGKIAGLGVAPDGVRVAAIVTSGDSTNQLELAAVAEVTPSSGQLGRQAETYTIGSTVVQLGPNVANPVALTWYDADDLLVLNGSGGTTTVWEVPVDGQPATRLPGVLPPAVSITANSTQNALVAGLASGQMEVSASLEAGLWQLLGSNGQNPAFPSAAPVAAPS
jgi:hypothetical protein